MVKTLFLDSETGGVNPAANVLIHLAGLFEIDGEIKGERLFVSKGWPDQICETAALEINGIKMSEILGYPPGQVMHEQFTNWLGQDGFIDRYDRADKCYVGCYNSFGCDVAGYNIGHFDMAFLRELFKRAGDHYIGSYFNGRIIDPYPILQWMVWRGDLVLPNLKLETVCAHFGIQLEEAHDAMADIKATRQLIRVVDDLVFSEKGVNSGNTDFNKLPQVP